MMRQAVLVDGEGTIRVGPIELPAHKEKEIVTANKCSLISSGTELSVVLGKRRKPARDAADFALGYSCAGVVQAVGRQCTRLNRDDRVASQGWAISVHAEANCVPEPLAERDGRAFRRHDSSRAARSRRGVE